MLSNVLAYLKKRYGDRMEVMRSLAHASFSANLMLFGFLKFGHYGLLSVLVGPLVEAVQRRTDPEYDPVDGCFDCAEWLVGSICAIIAMRYL